MFKNRYKAFSQILISTLIYGILILIPNYRHYPATELQNFISLFAHWGLSTFGLYAIFSIISLNKYIYAITLPIFSIISSTIAFFVWQIDISINSALIESIFLTNAHETFSYASSSLIAFLILTTIISLVLVWWRFQTTWEKPDLYPLILATIISIAIFATTNSLRFNTLMSRAPYSIYTAVNDYFKDKKEINSERLMIGTEAYSKTDSMITVFIIGEALRADHIQMNGYHRVTMPNMEKRGVISLPNIKSPYTHTAASIPYILSRADMNHKERVYNESSFIDIFNNCGFNSSWIANQNPITPFKFFINESNYIYINKPQLSDYSNSPKYDADLIKPFKERVAQINPKKIIILHIAGNHWWYNNNLPEEFIYYKPILKNKNLTLENKERMINSYDNVTLSTDHILNEIIKQLEDKKALLIFLADHGQSFGEEGKWLHANNMPAEQNPACFFWFSEKYKTEYPEKVNALVKNKEKQIDTAFLFHTIIAGSQLTTPYINNEYNLFHTENQSDTAGLEIPTKTGK